VIDVDVRQPHETLYEVLVVSPDASSREIRRVARALRRNLPDHSTLHDVCVAEQVLGRKKLRSEYDALLARLRAENQPVPRIGVAVERTWWRSESTMRLRRTGTPDVGKIVAIIALVILSLGAILIAMTSCSK
jgi:hypothetical protein